MVYVVCFFFFFKQKTAYEMRISDWSSDVCSSDLLQYPVFAQWLQEAYLGRMARALERLRYRDMLTQSLITGEMYSDLVKQIDLRWEHVQKQIGRAHV